MTPPPDALAQAACASEGVDVDLFFPRTDEQLDRAQQICLGCPVLDACRLEAERCNDLVGASATGLWGVWAGQLWVGGQIVARLPKQGRPVTDTATGAA